MHSGGKYVVIIVFRTAICQLSPSRYLLDLHSSCWVGRWDALCIVRLCVFKCMHAIHKVVHRMCAPDSMPWAIFHHNPLLSNSSSSPLSFPVSLVVVYISSTDSVCLIELFTFFRDAVIHWIYKYNSVCLCVVCMLDSKHSPCNDAQSIRCISCVCVFADRGWGVNASHQKNKILFAFFWFV